MRVLSSAATLKVKIARSTSVRAALIGLPASCARVRANSSLRCVDDCGYLPQHALAFESGEAARGAESLHGGCNGGFGMLSSALIDLRDHAAVIRRVDLDDIASSRHWPSTKKPCVATGTIVISDMIFFGPQKTDWNNYRTFG